MAKQLGNRFVKVWTDLLYDPWFMNLTINQRGIYLNLLLLTKQEGDIGLISRRNFSLLASEMNADRVTLTRALRRFHEGEHIHLEEGDGYIRIEVVDYQLWQEDTISRHSREAKDMVGNPPSVNTRPDQNRKEIETGAPPQTPGPPSDSNQKNVSEGRSQVPYDFLLDDLRERSGKNLQKSDGFRSAVDLLWRQGYREEDFLHVHMVKAEDWRGDPKMDQYLHWNTLYKPDHFDQYLAQRPVVKKMPVVECRPVDNSHLPRV